MRVRTHLRAIRAAQHLSITDVTILTGLPRGEISMYERGQSIPRDEHVALMTGVYGLLESWYPPSVRRTLLSDLPLCPGCGEELDPEASGRRTFHGEACRSTYRRRRTRENSARGPRQQDAP